MVPIILCSIISVAICIERFWTLRANQVAPKELLTQVWSWVKNDEMDPRRLSELRASSPLGRILAMGVSARHRGREVMKESIEEVANQVVHELERYLNTLGTLAAITPLLGLLGTVIGIIKELAVIRAEGAGSATAMAGGIAEALITTAAGLTVAIPSLFFYRFFQRRVDELVISMEQEALKLIDVLNASNHSAADHSRQAADR